VESESPRTRDWLASALAMSGIGTAVHYPSTLLSQPIFRGGVACPVSESVSRRILALPVHPAVTEGDIDAVVTKVHGAFGRN
jgi:perosamine synthetase